MKHWSKFKPTELTVIKRKKGKHWVSQYEPIFYDSETAKETYFENIVDNNGAESQREMVRDTWVYLWACSVGSDLYYGRYIHDFFNFLKVIQSAYDISPTKPIDIYIHNLSYDISYFYWFLFHTWEDIEISSLWTTPRHCITFGLGNGFTFKCSFRMSGRSLAKWAKDLNCKYLKQEGMITYKDLLYPWSPLPHEQYKYMAYDVLTLRECYYKEAKLQGYNFSNIPLTMTGFVRKDFQRAYLKKGKYFTNSCKFAETRLNEMQYNRLLRGSAGGMTAVSIAHISRKVDCEEYRARGLPVVGIGHADFESHYPTQEVTKRQPMRPNTIKEIGDKKTISLRTLDWYESKFHNYYMVDIELKDLRINKGVTAPFLFSSKLTPDVNARVIACNGKVVQVEGVVRCCLTNFDLRIIREQYQIGGYNVLACDLYSTAYLPAYMLDTIKKYYKDKTQIKIMMETDEDPDLQLNYNLSKSKLNSVFGCTYTKPVRPDIKLNSQYNFEIDYKANTLDDYYNRRNSCLAYQWGVWCTSLARYELYTIISKVIGYEWFLYCDTDSAFYLSTPEITERINEYNRKCLEDSKKNGFFVTLDDGTIKYFHKFDFEKDHEKSQVFKALHAKCYAIETDKGLKITVAGVMKENKVEKVTREMELGDIDNLKEGTVFKICGGTRADYSTIRDYDGKYTGGGCAILDTTKQLSETLFREKGFFV